MTISTTRPDPREEFFDREDERKNRDSELAGALGIGTPSIGGFRHGSEDAVAHLKQMPESLAIKKAREWTGRDDISSLDEAIDAVEEELGAGGS